MHCDGPKPRKAVGSIARFGRPWNRSNSTNSQDLPSPVHPQHAHILLFGARQTKPNAKAHDQTMAQWNTECHRNESGMPREARQLTDVNVSGVNPSRERA